MTRLIKTQSGSVYELDEDRMRIRRKSGIDHPRGIGRDWRAYENATVHGGSLVVVWQTDTGLVQSMKTSKIINWNGDSDEA